MRSNKLLERFWLRESLELVTASFRVDGLLLLYLESIERQLIVRRRCHGL